MRIASVLLQRTSSRVRLILLEWCQLDLCCVSALVCSFCDVCLDWIVRFVMMNALSSGYVKLFDEVLIGASPRARCCQLHGENRAASASNNNTTGTAQLLTAHHCCCSPCASVTSTTLSRAGARSLRPRTDFQLVRPSRRSAGIASCVPHTAQHTCARTRRSDRERSHLGLPSQLQDHSNATLYQCVCGSQHSVVAGAAQLKLLEPRQSPGPRAQLLGRAGRAAQPPTPRTDTAGQRAPSKHSTAHARPPVRTWGCW